MTGLHLGMHNHKYSLVTVIYISVDNEELCPSSVLPENSSKLFHPFVLQNSHSCVFQAMDKCKVLPFPHVFQDPSLFFPSESEKTHLHLDFLFFEIFLI